ncbi:J domain-containing protein [Anaerosporobacter faecicola]|uniref:J domain-containing protein n=1 Tax=Anaerosporobacter faecicola TaxID=2718714 RepID=UPI001438AACB|nr:J domain-containing protein [Anaerosporobacter faecicola]
MKWFHNPTSMEDVKKQYKALIRVYHPDNGGDLDKMQEINAEYNELCARFEKGGNEYSDYGYGYGYQSSGSSDEFSNYVRPTIEQEMNKTISILLTILQIYPAIQSKYDKLITKEPLVIYNDIPTVLKVAYEEMQRTPVASQANYQFINLMSELENTRRTTRQTYESACATYHHDLNQELNDLYRAVGNTAKEQILAAKQSGNAYWGGGNQGYYGQNYNSIYPHRNDGCDDCCQCLGCLMCMDCVDCC